MNPGDKPYGDRPHLVFSKTLKLPSGKNPQVIRGDTLAAIVTIKAKTTANIYLCGGGKFAGYLLKKGHIDRFLVKVSPLVYGDGIKLFEGIGDPRALNHVQITTYDTGVFLVEYAITK